MMAVVNHHRPGQRRDRLRRHTVTIVETSPLPALRPVAVDLYRDIHKGIRAELFAVTETAGRLNPSVPDERLALAAHVRAVVQLLVSHAEHEDGHIQPALEVNLPALAEQVAADHHRLEARLAGLAELADETAATGDARWPAHRLYVEMGAFTSSYLAHQDLEERVIMPALEDAIGPEAALEIHGAIVGSIPPDELAQSLAVMLPAMNVDDRAEMLGGMREEAPADVFEGVWSLAGSVLDPVARAALAGRLGVG
jgi:hypothetical protein